jgi:adenine-specific DNA-methyltransferase
MLSASRESRGTEWPRDAQAGRRRKGFQVTELNFKGKEFVYNHHLAVPFRPLIPHAEKGIGPVSLDGNLIIHGDNLHALKALLPIYAGKVDCIFIDPPYNTGNEGWCYNDNVNAPMIKEWLASNPIGIEDGLRHDKWCAMMWPRLRLLHELLSENGAVWVTISDHEHHSLRAMLDEIFGRENFVANIAWHARESVQNDTDISTNNLNHIVVYAKFRRRENRRLKSSNATIWRNAPGFVVQPKDIDLERFSNPDKDDRGPWKLDPFDAPGVRENLQYRIVNPNTGEEHLPPPGRHWGLEEPKFLNLLKENRILFGRNGRGRPGVKTFAEEKKEFGEVETNWWDGPATTTDGVKELAAIMGGNVFDNPKPTDLLVKIIKHATRKNSIILDSFAGSGTTGHAVLEANRRDGGNRRFVLVEMEAYADELTADRIRRVISGYTFSGTLRTQLLRKQLNWRAFADSQTILHEVEGIENLHAHEYDRIKKEVKDGDLIVTGEKTVTERAEGLGGSFTYCTLGAPLELDSLLRGETLPPYAGIGAVLFHMATNHAFDPAGMREADFYLGQTEGQHIWLFYKPDLDWLKSPEAALTLTRAKAISETDPEKRHLVFAPARFVSQKMLTEQKIQVEFVPLPDALYRIDRS